tara:strand:+ start:543 stop:773 length:231 start_codon:yes stop_codon:yes gene_type:complete
MIDKLIDKISFWFRIFIITLLVGTFLTSSYFMFSPFMTVSYGLLTVLGIAIISYVLAAISMVTILYYANKLFKEPL